MLAVSFNLVIEWLFISGVRTTKTEEDNYYNVSISLSSGFSFQGTLYAVFCGGG